MQIPGFVDLQVNGYKGVDFSSPELTEDTFCFACRELLKNGTAAFLPTVITSAKGLYARNLPLIANVISSGAFRGRILGLHLEGPFISPRPGAAGAHNPDWMVEPDISFFKQLQQWAAGNIRLITIAAEMTNAVEFTKHAVEQGVVVSLGHQMADYPDIKKVYDAGAKSMTHFGNGMPNQVPRHQNPILGALAIKNMKTLIITDGHHLPEPVIQTVFHAKAVEDVIVTSDASPIAGMKPGNYNVLGNDAVLEESGLLHNPQKQCLVGSSATMLECMNYLASLKFLSVEELLKVGFYNPLAFIGMDQDAVISDRRIEWNEKNNQFEIVNV
jgi:N-acetylglucosamine-6-phosphate deacetylase